MFATKSIFHVFSVLIVLASMLAFDGSSSVSAKNDPQESRLDKINTEAYLDGTTVGLSFGQALPTNQIIIKYKANSSASHSPNERGLMQRLKHTAGIDLTYLRPMSGDANVLLLPERLPLAQVQAISKKLTALPEVEYAEPDQILSPMLTPNDQFYAYQWDLFGTWGINAPAAWDLTTGSSSIVVAVIDTGITNHSDLDLSERTVPGYDFITEIPRANDGDGRDSDPSDPGDWVAANDCYPGSLAQNSTWHGTHVAGTIGASGNNSIGVTGINWTSKILPVRVLGKCGGYNSDIIDGMRWAAGLSVSGVSSNLNPAKVLNLSIAGPGTCNSSYQNAINQIISAGAVVVVAAGNDAADASGYFPASCTGVVTVAATDRSGNLADYSNRGSTIEISAPGGQKVLNADPRNADPNGILSTLNSGYTSPNPDLGGYYVFYEGTSMAAPHVSGVVSLMLSVNPSLTPAQVLQILQSSAKAFPDGSTCNTSICGSGILDAGAVVYKATPHISGNVGIRGAILNYTDGSPKTVMADGNGNYSIPVPYNWSGTVTPSKIGYIFTPADRTYTNVVADQTGQNYYATNPGTWQIVGTAGFSAGEADHTTIAMDHGTPYVAYSDDSAGRKVSVMKFDAGTGSWVTVGSAGFSSLSGYYYAFQGISLAVDNGTPYVAYPDNFMQDRLTVMKFDAVRGSWVTVGPPGFSAGDYVTDIHLAVDNGTPYVTYKDYDPGHRSIVKKFRNGRWEAVGAEGFVPYGGTIYSLDIHNGIPYVAYQDLSNMSNGSKVGVMKFDALTGNWVTVGSAVFTETFVNYNTASFAWDNCSPYASYRDDDKDFKATVKKFNGTDWVAVGPTAFSTTEAAYTSLALDHSTPFVGFVDWSGPSKATVMKIDGSNWVTVGPAGFSADTVGYLSLTLDKGTPYVAYMDWSKGGKATVMTFVEVPGTPDTTPPGVDIFTVDSLSASLDIPIAVFTASDSAGVTGYMITEIPIAPAADDRGWSDAAPTKYTVSSNGSYTLYPWVKDAAGNVSALFCSSASVEVDAIPPTVDSFTAGSLSMSLDIPITAFTASDDTGVTGYKITLSSTAPEAGDPGWFDAAPTTYTVGADGNYTLYPWAKDEADNVSEVYGSPASVQVDLPPYVVSFLAASPSSSLDIPIIQFTAADRHSVTGYLITESPISPAAGDPGWSATAPTTYTVGAEGDYTLYPWVTDTVGNVSDVWDPVTVSVIAHAPVTLIVTNNADSGTGSLRQAIADSGPGDAITFDSSLSGETIPLASTLRIDKSLTIDGTSLASPITISGADAYRVFDVGSEVSSIIVTLRGLTISHGYLIEDGGAGIVNAGALTLTNSTLSGNSAGSGGAIYNVGILTITNSTFSGNSVTGDGGGIYNYGTVSVTNSTFSGNSAYGDGGGIYNNGNVTLTNSTLSGNSAWWSGGIYNAYWGTLNYSNTIVANSPRGEDVFDLGNSSSQNNLIGTVALGALADNGGPTQTMALPAGSPAIDAGANTICAAAPVNGLDQRGVARDAACDIGAYEYVPVPDISAPTVDEFTAESPSWSLDIPISFFTASDDIGITGYLITQSATAPAADNAGWEDTAPTTYTVSEDGSYTLYPWVKDAAGHVSALFDAPASVEADATPPSVDAGSYQVEESASVTVTASGDDAGNGPLTYAWDLDNDGSFETPGQSATFSATNLDGPSIHTIAVQVTDSGGLTATDQATVDVPNVAPTADFTSTPSTLLAGQSATLSFSNPFDPSAEDVAAGFRYSYDCTNDGTFELESTLDASYTCAYPSAGTFMALGRISDKDGSVTFYRVMVQAIATSTYTLTDLGTLGGRESYPVAINEAGQVVGYASSANGSTHAFLWDDGVMTDLGTLGGSFSRPAAINEAGQVTGWSTLANGSTHAFLWESGVMIDLDTLGSLTSQAEAINEAGQVIGYSYLENGSYHAFIWENGVMTDLGTLGGTYTEAIAINEAGQVIGYSYLAGGAGEHAFLWENGVMTDLGTLGGSLSQAVAINEVGQVTGWSHIAGNTGTHGFLWENGVMTDLGTLGSSSSYPAAINEAGQVIGYSNLENGSTHGFLWENGVMTDLGTLGSNYNYPAAINEAGQVIGFSLLVDGGNRAFYWEGGVLADLSLGGSYSRPAAINEAGQVIGYSYLVGDTGADAFVWKNGVMTDLGTLGSGGSQAIAINEAGQVIGVSYLASGGYHAFKAEFLSGNTPSGDNVTVSPGNGTTLTFANVSSEGQTTVNTSSSAPPLPVGFSLENPRTFYDISTTATYSPPVTVCITYDPVQFGDSANLHLLHYENDAWVDATASNNTTNHVICGQVNSLSPFVVAERATYAFSGFFQPVDNLPTLNILKAGSTVPMKFSLSGDQGLGIFDTGYPISQLIVCEGGALLDNIEQTVSAGDSGLQYDATNDTYTYTWKTQKSWAGTCRQLIVRLNDGTEHIANFQFKK